MDLNQFMSWQREKPSRRSVDIKINPNETQTWVYDYDMAEGQFVRDASEIDLEGARERRERRQLERLQAKYGSHQKGEIA